MIAAHQKVQALEWRVGTYNPTPRPLGRKLEARDWVWLPMASDLINMFTQWNWLEIWTARFEELSGWWTHWGSRRVCAQKGLGSSVPPILIPCPISSSFWLFLSYIFENKTVIVSIVLSWVPWVVLANDWTWGGNLGTWEFVVDQADVWVAWEFHLQLVSKVRAVLWYWALDLWGLC